MTQARTRRQSLVAPADQSLTNLAESRHGVFSLAQARDLGISEALRNRRVRDGRWKTLYPGVYRMAGSPLTWHGKVLAACLGAPGPGVASHRSAAHLWQLPGGTDRFVEITCARWQRMHSATLVVHETGALPSEDVTTVAAIPCMTVERTVLSLGAVLPPSVVEMAVDNALRRQLTTIDDLRAMVRRLGRRGRNGVGVLRQIVALHDAEAGLTESAMETRLKRILREHGLPTPRFQHEVRCDGRFVARVDAADPELRIAIEYDSYAHHLGREALVRDSRRRNALVAIGWSVISVTAPDLAAGANRLITAIRSARVHSGAARAS